MQRYYTTIRLQKSGIVRSRIWYVMIDDLCCGQVVVDFCALCEISGSHGSEYEV
jgi:hypothetical protein